MLDFESRRIRCLATFFQESRDGCRDGSDVVSASYTLRDWEAFHRQHPTDGSIRSSERARHSGKRPAVNYDAIIEQLEFWAVTLESMINRDSNLDFELGPIISGMRDVAADLARESILPAEFRSFGPGDPKTRSDSLNEIIARLRARGALAPASGNRK